MVVCQFDMLADARGDDACTLLPCLFHHDFSHDGRVGIVEVTDRLIHKQEIERLAQSTNQRHTLLLTKGDASHLGIELIADAQHLKPSQDLLLRLMSCQLVLDVHILPRRQFGEHPEFLPQQGKVVLTDVRPASHRILAYVFTIEENLSLIVMSVAIDVAA